MWVDVFNKWIRRLAEAHGDNSDRYSSLLIFFFFCDNKLVCKANQPKTVFFQLASFDSNQKNNFNSWFVNLFNMKTLGFDDKQANYLLWKTFFW